MNRALGRISKSKLAQYARRLGLSARTAARWVQQGVPEAVKERWRRRGVPKSLAPTPRKPKSKPSPEPSAAELALAREPSTAPKLIFGFATKPKSKPTVKPTPKPKPKPATKPTPKPKPAAKPTPKPKPKPAVKPTPKPKPKPAAAPPKRRRGPTDRDIAILSVWSNLAPEAQEKYYGELSRAGRFALKKQRRLEKERLARADRRRRQKEREQARELARQERYFPVWRRLRTDLERAIAPAEIRQLIAAEVHFDKARTPTIIQHKGEAEALAASVVVPSPAPVAGGAAAEPTYRYYAVIAAVTQHPPEAHYGQRAVGRDTSLTVFYFSAKTATSEAELTDNIAAAIEHMRAQLPGDAPMAIVGVHVRTALIPSGAA